MVSQMSDECSRADTTRDDIAIWLFTSGSTGKPKGAVHLHHDLPYNTECYAKRVLGITENDLTLAVPKLFFGYATGTNLLFPFAAGGATALFKERSTPQKIFEAIERYEPTILTSVPTMINSMLNLEDGDAYDLSSLRMCLSAGEALPVNIGRSWSERFGVDILDGLGCTETVSTFLCNREGAVRYGTSGKPVPGFDIRLVDETGAVVAQGEMGELQVRGPTTAIMYWNDREQSRSTFLGEWLRSGDKYIEDKDGYYSYCGRRDDMMKVGGIYVSPIEVEGALLSHPDVLEAAVAGWPDEDGLIRPKAFVILKPFGEPNEAMALALREHCRKQLATFKYPRWIEFRTELPKTATGKTRRFKLRAEAAQDDRTGSGAAE